MPKKLQDVRQKRIKKMPSYRMGGRMSLRLANIKTKNPLTLLDLPPELLTTIFDLSGNILSLTATCRRVRDVIESSPRLMSRLTALYIQDRRLCPGTLFRRRRYQNFFAILPRNFDVTLFLILRRHVQHLKHLQVLFRETAIVRPYQDVPLQFLKILVLRRAHCFLDFEARPLQSWMFGACESIQLETLKFYDAEMKDCTEFLESFRISETIRECTLRRWEEPAQNVRKRAAIFRDFDTGTVWEWLRKAKN